ncbi:MAG: hypothetical protein ACOYI4_01020 [Christensenellales bacterium]|jgi:hypothetical protein
MKAETTIYNKDKIKGGFESVLDDVDDAINAADYKTFTAYASDMNGTAFSLTNNQLQYVGTYVSTNNEQSLDFTQYSWRLNPEWAARFANDYIQDIAGGIKIVNPENSNIYAGLSSLALAFVLEGIEQARLGYDVSRDAYGLVAHDIFAFGSGAGVKFDGSSNATVRGRFVWEIRDNGHLSLKLY